MPTGDFCKFSAAAKWGKTGGLMILHNPRCSMERLHGRDITGQEGVTPQNSDNIPRRLCFSMALFERHIFGGAHIRRGQFLNTEGNSHYKIGQAYTWGEICVKKSIGLAYSCKEIYVSNLQKRFTETRLEDVDLFKTQPLQELCLYGPRKSKPRVKCELRKQQ